MDGMQKQCPFLKQTWEISKNLLALIEHQKKL